jgi:hypothetical protein
VQVSYALRQERVVHVSCGYYHNLAVTDTGRLYQWGKLYKIDDDPNAEKHHGISINLPGMNEQRAKLISKSHRQYYAGGMSAAELSEEMAESDQMTNFGTFIPCTAFSLAASRSHSNCRHATRA